MELRNSLKRVLRDADARTWGLAALCWFLFFALVSLLPIEPLLDLAALRQRLQTLFEWDTGASALHAVFQRAVTMGPLGFLLCQWLARRPVNRPLLCSLVLVLLAASTVETAQFLFSARHGRLGDWLVATAAGSAGAIVCHLRGRRSWVFIRAPLVGNAIVIGMVIWVEASSSLATWDCNFRLAIGNELTGDRPWVGQVDSPALYIGRLSHEQAAKLARTPADYSGRGRLNLGLVELYRRTNESGRLSAEFGGAGNGDLVRTTVTNPGGNQPKSSGSNGANRMLISEKPATRFCQLAMATDAFAVEAWIIPGDSTQSGPARIITLSSDTGHRNFTLGQQGDRLVFRVRTVSNGDNGSNVQPLTDARLDEDIRRHVVATFSAGEVALFVDGRSAGPVVRLYDRLIFGDLFWAPLWLVSGFVLALAGAFVAAQRFHRDCVKLIAVVAVGMPAIMSLAIAALSRGHELDVAAASAAIVGPIIGAATLGLWRSRVSAT